MIELYEGRLGGGKTYSATVRMVDHFRRGGVVCTNVELIWPKIKSYIEDKWGLIAEDSQFIPLSDDQIGLFHHFTPSGTKQLPVLVVIDEAHLTFNARDFAKTDKLYRETLTFLTQSRKVNTDVIFIAQSVLNMDKQFMRLVQFIWRFRDLAKWKIPGLGIAYPLKQILAVQFDYDGKTILQRSFVRKDTKIFGLYNTDSLIKPFPRLEVAKTHRTLAKKEKKPVKILLPIGIIIGIIGAFLLYKKVSAIGTPKVAIVSDSRSVNTTPPPKPATIDPTKEEKKENENAYDIYAEAFQAWDGHSKSLKTDVGWYQLAEMSGHGYVSAISDHRVKIAQPNGRTGWVVANHDAIRPLVPVPTPTPTPVPSASPSKEINIITEAPKQHSSEPILVQPLNGRPPTYARPLSTPPQQ